MLCDGEEDYASIMKKKAIQCYLNTTLFPLYS